jgi:multidrug efflux system outer membrane protein
LKTQYQVSNIEREKTIISFRQSVIRAAGEVSDALVKVEKIKEQQKIAQEKVWILQQSIGNAKMLFTNGMANYLEVITAQGNVLQGELSLAQLQKEQSEAVIELYRSLGGGWQ